MEWDEPLCGDKQNRVNPWEIETPESLFIFPSLTSSLKRPFQSAFFGKKSSYILSSCIHVYKMFMDLKGKLYSKQERKQSGKI